MILPRGITGFGSINTDPPLFLDEKAFCRMCHALAQENGGAVTEVDTDTAIRNFYSAKVSRYDQSVFLLQNIHYPYAAFAQREASGRFVLTQQPEWLQLPEGSVRFLSCLLYTSFTPHKLRVAAFSGADNGSFFAIPPLNFSCPLCATFILLKTYPACWSMNLSSTQ